MLSSSVAAKSDRLIVITLQSRYQERSSCQAVPANKWTGFLTQLVCKTNLRHKTHHIRVPVKCLHPSQQLLVIPQTDQDLRVVPYTLLQDRQRALRHLELFQLPDLSLIQVGLVHVRVLTGGNQIATLAAPGEFPRLKTHLILIRVVSKWYE